MSNITRIAHISDLHYEDNSEWHLQFNQLKKALISQEPDLIINTGDVLHSPTSSDFIRVSKKLSELCVSIEEKANKEIFLVSVPGNHDIFMLGLLPHKPGAYTECAYKDYSHLLNYPQGVGLEGIISSIFDKTRIALFPFDSNEIRVYRDFFAMAQGKIKDSEIKYDHYNNLFNNHQFSKLKIAILHHHPLPMAISTTDEYKEPFLLLRKAHNFLTASLSNNVDLILHGHMHRLGASEYRSLLPKISGKPLRIFGCGSSGAITEDKKQFTIHDVDETGHVDSIIYESTAISDGYKEDETIELIPYKHIRKINNKNGYLYNNDRTIKSARQKSKIVRILSKGDALIDIFIDNLFWQPNSASDNDFIITERATADVGRIPWYDSYLGTEVPRPDKNYFLSKLTNSRFDVLYNKIPEDVSLIVRRQLCETSRDYYCQVRYMMYGGYCLTKNEHEWLYNNSNLEVRREFCYSFVEYPTDILEINIRFPDERELPDLNSIKLLAIKKSSINYSENGYSFLNEDYDNCETESEFLKEKHALSIRPSTFEINARIRYPQPDLIYLLRWDLPSSQVNYGLRKECDKFRKLIDTNYNLANKFWELVHLKVSKVITWIDFNLALLSITFEDDSGVVCFRGAAGPPRYIDKRFFITRGIAGRAFKQGTFKIYNTSSPDEDEQYIEKIDENFNPSAAISIPVIFNFDRICIDVSYEDPNSGNLLIDPTFDPESQVLCVFSLVFFDYPGDLNEIDFGKIEVGIEESFNNVFCSP